MREGLEGFIVLGEVVVTPTELKQTLHFLYVLDMGRGKSRVVAYRVTQFGKLLAGTLVVGLALQYIQKKLFGFIIATNLGVFDGYSNGGIADNLYEVLAQTVGGRALGQSLPRGLVLLECQRIFAFAVSGTTLLQENLGLVFLSLAACGFLSNEAVLSGLACIDCSGANRQLWMC